MCVGGLYSWDSLGVGPYHKLQRGAQLVRRLSRLWALCGQDMVLNPSRFSKEEPKGPNYTNAGYLGFLCRKSSLYLLVDAFYAGTRTLEELFVCSKML